MLYSFVWVIPWHLNFMCRCFGTLCLFHLHRSCEQEEQLGQDCQGIYTGKSLAQKKPGPIGRRRDGEGACPVRGTSCGGQWLQEGACSTFGIKVQVCLFSILVNIVTHKSFLNCRYNWSIIIKNLTHVYMKLLSFSCQYVYLQLHQ